MAAAITASLRETVAPLAVSPPFPGCTPPGHGDAAHCIEFRLPYNARPMNRGWRHCFWLRLAVIAAAAAFVKANGPAVYAPATSEGTVAGPKALATNEDSPPPKEDAEQDSDHPRRDDSPSGSGATFIAVRPEIHEQGSGLIRRLCPREPVSGLHQPVSTFKTTQDLSLRFEVERPAEPELIQVMARPILRHGPPLARSSFDRLRRKARPRTKASQPPANCR